MKAITLFFCIVSGYVWAQPTTIVGYAYDSQQGELRYTEIYQNRYSPEGNLVASEVEYRPADSSSPLATKTLHYHKHPYAPEFTFTNHITRYAESIRWEGVNTVLIRHRESDTWQQRTLEVSEPVVADAGFDAFLKDNIDRLEAGKTVKFNFLNPARLDWYRFSAEPIKQTAATITINVYPRNPLIRWLVDPILLTYQLPTNTEPTPRLVRYSGLTNISLNDHSPVIADIVYEYGQRPPEQIVNLF